jgi:DnaJ-domain-containing protein 1
MPDPFIAAAGPAPARGTESRWRQVALLAASAALGDSAQAAAGLAATLLSLDHPEAAAAALRSAPADDPWARWWRVLAAGQSAGAEGLDEALAAALGEPAEGPDGREVVRRLADLQAELAAMRGGDPDPARFALLGHRPRPERRVVLGGRSSAAFLAEPGWDALRLVRLAPSEGPALGNRAHSTLAEVVSAVRRGEAGPGWTVPDDAPDDPDPEAMLAALREDPATRDRRLISLAREVAEERERLAAERAALMEERARVAADRARRRRVGPAPPPPPASASAQVAVPRTEAEASALLGLSRGVAPDEVERAYREQVSRCHPDRVAGLHPAIQGQAERLTVALNAARDLLLGRSPRRRPQRASG